MSTALRIARQARVPGRCSALAIQLPALGPLSATRPACRPSGSRSIVSFNDLARLSPFGGGGSNGSSEEGDQYTETVTMPFPRDHLFEIVRDVEAYQHFVPYCIGSRILSTEEARRFDSAPVTRHDDANTFLAELTVGFGTLQERYTSRVHVDPSAGRVVAEAIPTPLFRHLRTSWTISALSATSSRVDFEVRYAFSNPLYAAMAKAAMHKMASQMIGAFEKRAVQQAHQR